MPSKIKINSNIRIGVLGAGLAGLFSAFVLLDKGIRNVEVLEKEKSYGGLLQSEFINGFTFDTGGSHIIFSRSKSLIKLILSFLGNNYVSHRRNTKIFLKGRYIKYPFENGLGELAPEDKFFALYEYIKAWIQREKGEILEPENFLEWIHYWFGRGISELYLIPYNKKIWKYPLDKMGLDWVSGRVPSPPLEDVIKSALGISTEGYVHQLNFFYPLRGGIQSLADGIASRIKELGGEIITSFEVKEIVREDDKWIVKSANDEREYDFVINTIPIPKLVSILRDSPLELRKIGKKLKWNSLIVVGIAVNKPRIKDYHWVYFPNEAIFHRLAFISNYSPFMAPEGKSSIIAEITVPYNALSSKEIEYYADQVIEDLVQLKIVNEKDIIFTRTWTWEYGYVINHLNYRQDMEFIKKYLDSISLISVGRWGAWRYLNMDTTIKNVIDTLNASFGFLYET